MRWAELTKWALAVGAAVYLCVRRDREQPHFLLDALIIVACVALVWLGFWLGSFR